MKCPRIGKSTETTMKISGYQGLGVGSGVGREWGVTVNGYRVSYWGDENVLKLIVVMVVQFCEYTLSH